MELLIEGVDHTGYIREVPGAARYRDELGTRTRLSFILIDPANGLDIDVGQDVRFTDDVGGALGGTIETVEEEILTDADHPLDVQLVTIEVVSHDQILSRRLYAAEHEDALAGDIARDIIAMFADDGVDDLYIEDGPVITGRHIFNYDSADEAFDRVLKLSGMAYWIDADLHAHLQARESTPAPFELSEANYFVRSLKKRRTREQYRNVQFIRAGNGLTDSRVETFVGDGERRTFSLAFPAGTEPTITVNAASKTVGIKGVETGADWYWNKDSNEISQDDGDTPLTASDDLAVTYRGLFPVIVQARSDSAIAERIAVEGGSGIYEKKEDQPQIDDQDAALATAVARLAQKGYIPEELVMTTRESGLRAGMLLPALVPREGLDGSYLITSVDGSCDALAIFNYTVRAVNGDGVGGWTDYFRQQARRAQTDVASDNEYLLLLRSIGAPVLCEDVLTATPGGSGAAKIDEAIIGFSEIG